MSPAAGSPVSPDTQPGYFGQDAWAGAAPSLKTLDCKPAQVRDPEEIRLFNAVWR